MMCPGRVTPPRALLVYQRNMGDDGRVDAQATHSRGTVGAEKGGAVGCGTPLLRAWLCVFHRWWAMGQSGFSVLFFSVGACCETNIDRPTYVRRGHAAGSSTKSNILFVMLALV